MSVPTQNQIDAFKISREILIRVNTAYSTYTHRAGGSISFDEIITESENEYAAVVPGAPSSPDFSAVATTWVTWATLKYEQLTHSISKTLEVDQEISSIPASEQYYLSGAPDPETQTFPVGTTQQLELAILPTSTSLTTTLTTTGINATEDSILRFTSPSDFENTIEFKEGSWAVELYMEKTNTTSSYPLFYTELYELKQDLTEVKLSSDDSTEGRALAIAIRDPGFYKFYMHVPKTTVSHVYSRLLLKVMAYGHTFPGDTLSADLKITLGNIYQTTVTTTILEPFINPNIGPIGPPGQNGISAGLNLYYDGATVSQTAAQAAVSPPTLALITEPNLGAQTSITTTNVTTSPVICAKFLFPTNFFLLDQIVYSGVWASYIYAYRSNNGSKYPHIFLTLREVAADGVTVLDTIVEGSVSSGVKINALDIYSLNIAVPLTHTVVSPSSRLLVEMWTFTNHSNATLVVQMRDASVSFVRTTLDVHILQDVIGSTGLIDGVRGVVPAPTVGQQNRYLRGDGTWSDVISSTDDTVTVSADVAITGFATVGTTLDVVGATTIGGVVDINNTVDMNNTVTLSKTTGTSLIVASDSTIGGTLTIAGALDSNSTADIADTLTLSKTSGTGLDVSADVLVGGAMGITGATTLSTLTTSGDIGCGVAPASTYRLTVSGDTYIEGDTVLKGGRLKLVQGEYVPSGTGALLEVYSWSHDTGGATLKLGENANAYSYMRYAGSENKIYIGSYLTGTDITAMQYDLVSDIVHFSHIDVSANSTLSTITATDGLVEVYQGANVAAGTGSQIGVYALGNDTGGATLKLGETIGAYGYVRYDAPSNNITLGSHLYGTDVNAIQYTRSSNNVYFPGRIGIGLSSPSFPLSISASFSTSVSRFGWNYTTGNYIVNEIILFSGTYAISANFAEYMIAKGYFAHSDRRIKTNESAAYIIDDIDGVVATDIASVSYNAFDPMMIMCLEPKQFEYIDSKSNGPTLGFVAQDISGNVRTAPDNPLWSTDAWIDVSGSVRDRLSNGANITSKIISTRKGVVPSIYKQGYVRTSEPGRVWVDGMGEAFDEYTATGAIDAPNDGDACSIDIIDSENITNTITSDDCRYHTSTTTSIDQIGAVASSYFDIDVHDLLSKSSVIMYTPSNKRRVSRYIHAPTGALIDSLSYTVSADGNHYIIKHIDFVNKNPLYNLGIDDSVVDDMIYIRVVVLYYYRDVNGEDITDVDDPVYGGVSITSTDVEEIPNFRSVFVYGHNVTDFGVVDYQSITALNVAGTQYALGRINQLEATNQELTAALAALTARIDALEQPGGGPP